MRNLFGSLNSSGGVLQQFLTADQPLVTAATLKARSTNGGQVYIGNSSAVTSGNGFMLNAGDALAATYEPGGVKGTSFWMLASDASQYCDYFFVMEN